MHWQGQGASGPRVRRQGECRDDRLLFEGRPVCNPRRRSAGQSLWRPHARLLADAGYRGHNAPADYKFRVYTLGQKRRLTPQIKRELRQRAAIEPVIGHLKTEHTHGSNYLAHGAGDAINAVLAVAGYNFHLLLKWLEFAVQNLGGSESTGQPSTGLKIENFTDE